MVPRNFYKNFPSHPRCRTINRRDFSKFQQQIFISLDSRNERKSRGKSFPFVEIPAELLNREASRLRHPTVTVAGFAWESPKAALIPTKVVGREMFSFKFADCIKEGKLDAYQQRTQIKFRFDFFKSRSDQWVLETRLDTGRYIGNDFGNSFFHLKVKCRI